VKFDQVTPCLNFHLLFFEDAPKVFISKLFKLVSKFDLSAGKDCFVWKKIIKFDIASQ
jgi:hypothetical protein